MKVQWPKVWEEFWDRLVQKMIKFGIKFLAGDFNMSLTDVTCQLRSRGVVSDCVAWYPWMHATKTLNNQGLGLDSCGIFYIGGNMQSKVWWDHNMIPYLRAEVDDYSKIEACIPAEKRLDLYLDDYHPGQHWGAYRSRGKKLDPKWPALDGLEQRLEDLLTPSTTQDKLDRMRNMATNIYCPYLRTKPTKMDLRYWCPLGKVNMGAHFPLCVFTDNARSRTQEAATARSQRRTEKNRLRWTWPNNWSNWSPVPREGFSYRWSPHGYELSI
jgi:hypothetical protein